MKIYKISTSIDDDAEKEYQQHLQEEEHIKDEQLRLSIKSVVLRELKGIYIKKVTVNGKLVNNQYIDLRIGIQSSERQGHQRFGQFRRMLLDRINSGKIHKAVEEFIGVFPTISIIL